MNQFESSEDYLERILMLIERNGKVRSIDLANDMSFSKASVSIAMKKLKEKNYITVDSGGFIFLTSEGERIARYTLEKHKVLFDILCKLGVNSETADLDACKLEHELSDESFEAIKSYFKS